MRYLGVLWWPMIEDRAQEEGHHTRKLRLYNLAGSDAARAYLHLSCLTIVKTPHLLQIGIPASLSLIMSVTDIVAYYRPFATDFTHPRHLGVSLKIDVFR